MSDTNPMQFMRNDYVYRIDIDHDDNEGRLQASIVASFTVRNITDQPAEYQSIWHVTDEGTANNPKLEHVVIKANSQLYYGSKEFVPSTKRKKVLEAESAKVIISPHEEALVEWALSKRVEAQGSELLSFAYPTDGVHILVRCPLDIEPVVDQIRQAAKSETPHANGIYAWDFEGVFENEQHLIVRWYPLTELSQKPQ